YERSEVQRLYFLGMELVFVGANSPSQLSSRPVRYVFYDEADKFPLRAGNDADPFKLAAERTAAHMRQHGIKILHVMAGDFTSANAQQMLQAFVDANDQLEGITAVKRDPYDGDHGKIYWFTNKNGYDIPCVTASYKMWAGFNTPASLAKTIQKENQTSQSFNTIAVHAWSNWSGLRASDAVQQCVTNLPENFVCVSMQELIWRLRYQERKEQTLEYLKSIK
ncbi:MAG: phage terminase large subunit family protein, partial [Bacteroidales bacterium]|nr:phage terminase large subunit family protein [Bacteroidales bacterium]